MLRYRPKGFKQRSANGQGNLDGVRRVPYRLPELLKAASEAKPIFIAEGEKAADALSALGVAATCSPMGAGKWRDEYALHFAGAGDVIILPDNDDVGEKHAADIKRSIASARVLRLPGLPDKGDAFDWIAAGGTVDELYKIAKEAPQEQTAPPPTGELRFTLTPFNQIKLDTQRRDLIKGLIPRSGVVVVWGPPKCGKSFKVSDALLHVALGWEWRGRKVRQGPVVYCSFEGHEGVPRRCEAFRQKFLQENTEPVPFYTLLTSLSLANDHEQLLTELRQQLGNDRPVAIALDTLNRSLGGSESSDEDMSDYLRAAETIGLSFDCVVIIVHHCGVAGDRPRGHTSLTGTVVAQVAVCRDANNNIVARVEYMKDGAEGDEIGSRLEVVEVGIDEDGDTITSCVLVPTDPVTTRKTAKGMRGAPLIALEQLRRAINHEGEAAPTSNHIDRTKRVVRLTLWRRYCDEATIAETDKPDSKLKAFSRACTKLQSLGLVGVWGEWAWLE